MIQTLSPENLCHFMFSLFLSVFFEPAKAPAKPQLPETQTTIGQLLRLPQSSTQNLAANRSICHRKWTEMPQRKSISKTLSGIALPLQATLDYLILFQSLIWIPHLAVVHFFPVLYLRLFAHIQTSADDNSSIRLPFLIADWFLSVFFWHSPSVLVLEGHRTDSPVLHFLLFLLVPTDAIALAHFKFCEIMIPLVLLDTGIYLLSKPLIKLDW